MINPNKDKDNTNNNLRRCAVVWCPHYKRAEDYQVTIIIIGAHCASPGLIK